MVEIIWTIQSIEDIENIAEYIAKDSEKYAQIQVQDFFEATKTLEEFPKAGRIVPELNNKGIREVIVGFYRVIYHLISKERIEVLAVHHSYRLLKKRAINKRRKK
ncbi:MAG: type II toxin-antitoxin system RelE/ParE family toxin [Bacteroidetes bacterium]|nr:type II toxin-antitoxin system RelE/ParE family toxin [Bacteroidota bacterium]